MTSDENVKEAREELEGNKVLIGLMTGDENVKEAREELEGNKVFV